MNKTLATIAGLFVVARCSINVGPAASRVQVPIWAIEVAIQSEEETKDTFKGAQASIVNRGIFPPAARWSSVLIER